MFLRTQGIPVKVPLAICKKALDFYARKLLTTKTFSEIHITLKFDVEDLTSSDFGCTEWIDTNLRAREYIITVKPALGIRSMLTTIAHEMVHVKQYATGQLVDYIHSSKQNKCRWRGKIRNNFDDTMGYWDLPWEIEAHGRELGLYYQFLSENKSKKRLMKKRK